MVVQELWESSQSKDLFGGRLTLDFVAERHVNSDFAEIREMDFTQCGLQTVDVGDGLQFQNLRRSFNYLRYLPFHLLVVFRVV